jgi:transcriptional regulator with XRE-family HTH domain
MSINAKVIAPKGKNRSDNPDPVDVHVGAQLRLRRNILGLSQEQLGKATGLTFQQIQKYERGINRIGASRLFEFSRILNVKVAYFYEGLVVAAKLNNVGFSDTEQAPLEDISNTALGKDEDKILQRRDVKELIRAYDRITDPKKRRIVYDLAKSMIDE